MGILVAVCLTLSIAILCVNIVLMIVKDHKLERRIDELEERFDWLQQENEESLEEKSEGK